MTDLFGAESIEDTEAAGHRTTPAHVGRTLVALMGDAARDHVLDLGCGDGALSIAVHTSGCRPLLSLVDNRPGVAAHTEQHLRVLGARVGSRGTFDAARQWPASAREFFVALPVGAVVTNPPWSRQHCATCGQTWDAGHHGHCKSCSSYDAEGKLVHRVEGQDLAQAMVAQAMVACESAEIWVIHTTDWRFHEARARFFLPSDDSACTRPPTHVLAGITDVAERVAWGDPAKRGRVARHNKMTSFYHFAPSVRATAQPYHRMLATWCR